MISEKQTLETVAKFLSYKVENGTEEELREINIHVSSQVLKVNDIMKRHWPQVIKEGS